MVDLYRFMKREYAERFLQGKLYMNALGYFWSHGIESQMDFNEGTARMLDPEQTPLPPQLRLLVKGSVRYRLEAYKYCSLLCMVIHHYNTQNMQAERFDNRMRNFGECAVRIINVEVFLQRVFEKAKEQGDYCLAGPMNYLPTDTVRDQMDCFDKLQSFAWQKEWRIAYVHNIERLKQLAKEDPVRIYEEPYTLDIGDISGIAEIVSGKDLFDTPQNIYKGYKIVDSVNPMVWPNALQSMGIPAPYQWDASTYKGWGDRNSFQNKVIEIDGGKQRIGFDI